MLVLLFRLFCFAVMTVEYIEASMQIGKEGKARKNRGVKDIPQYLLDMYNVVSDENGIRRKEAPDLGNSVVCLYAQGKFL